jgi:hypothetical protein
MMWERSIGRHEPEYAPLSAQQAIARIRDGRPSGDRSQTDPAMQYAAPIERLLALMTYVGSYPTQYLPSEALPVQLVAGDAEPRCLIVSVASDARYNALKFSARGRAQHVMRCVIRPALRDLDAALYETDLDAFGVAVFYGAGDASSASDRTARAEALCAIVSRLDCHEFVIGEMTQDEMVRRSLLFLSDCDAGLAFSRVELSLE